MTAAEFPERHYSRRQRRGSRAEWELLANLQRALWFGVRGHVTRRQQVPFIDGTVHNTPV